jgi:predicted aspartyl protease
MRRFGGIPDLARRLILCVPALLCANSGSALAGECAPLRLENSVKMVPLGDQGLMGMPIALNGLAKTFLFDTGGVENFISGKVVQELKTPQFFSPFVSDMRGNVSDSAVRVRKVAFGGIEARYVRFQVAPNLPYDGILAAKTMAQDSLRLANDDLDMDFGAGTLGIYSTDHCDGAGVAGWPRQAIAAVPVTEMRGHIELPVTLDGHPLTAAIDTGAPWTIVNIARAAEKLGFSPNAPEPPGAPRGDPGQQIYFRRYSALSFEGITITNPLVIVRPVHFGGKDDPTVLASRAQHLFDTADRFAPDIIIGMEVLRHLHLYYAIKEHKLYVTPAK